MDCVLEKIQTVKLEIDKLEKDSATFSKALLDASRWETTWIAWSKIAVLTFIFLVTSFNRSTVSGSESGAQIKQINIFETETEVEIRKSDIGSVGSSATASDAKLQKLRGRLNLFKTSLNALLQTLENSVHSFLLRRNLIQVKQK